MNRNKSPNKPQMQAQVQRPTTSIEQVATETAPAREKRPLRAGGRHHHGLMSNTRQIRLHSKGHLTPTKISQHTWLELVAVPITAVPGNLPSAVASYDRHSTA